MLHMLIVSSTDWKPVSQSLSSHILSAKGCAHIKSGDLSMFPAAAGVPKWQQTTAATEVQTTSTF